MMRCGLLGEKLGHSYSPAIHAQLADYAYGLYEVAPEDLPRLGERGFTGYNGRAEHGSTGLGLYLCRRICGLLGHGLRFESELGRGPRAILSFPEYRLEAE